MEVKKRYLIVLLIVLFCIVCLITAYPEKNEVVNNVTEESSVAEEEENKLEEVNVSGYHLVTYNQASNANSFLKSLTVTASNEGEVKFVIGEINENSFVIERTSFILYCEKGENTFDLENERYLVKTGEYLFMDIYGQNTLYKQNNVKTTSLVQQETNKVQGKMPMTQSNYILPFKYSLGKVQEYNALVIGNDITTKDGGVGIGATDSEHDYYYLTKERLKNTFNKVNINRINATQWEKNEGLDFSRENWINENLETDLVSELDLVIFQLGDNYNKSDDFEEGIIELVEYVRNYSPNAEMIWLGLWNINEKRLNLLPGICERLGIEFINISDLNTEEYQTIVQETSEIVDENLIVHENFTEARYPNNEAMQMISNRIIHVLKYDF